MSNPQKVVFILISFSRCNCQSATITDSGPQLYNYVFFNAMSSAVMHVFDKCMFNCSCCNQGLYKSKGWNDINDRAARNADIIMARVDGDTDGVLTEQEFIVGISSRDDLVCLIFGNEPDN